MLWRSRSSSPWSWRSRRHSSKSHRPGPSSSLWWNSSSLCLCSIFPDNHLTQHGCFPDWTPLATHRQAPQKIPWWAGQARSWPCTNTVLWLTQKAKNTLDNSSKYIHSHSDSCRTSVRIVKGRGWNTRQLSSAESSLCHRIPCDLEFLCPARFPAKTAYSSKHPTPALIRLLCLSCCACSLRASLPPALPSWAPPSGLSQEEKPEAEPVSLLLPPVLLVATCCAPSYLFLSYHLGAVSAPVLPSRPLPPQTSKSQTKGRNASHWQVSSRLCQGACWESWGHPLVLTSLPFSHALSGYCNWSETIN